MSWADAVVEKALALGRGAGERLVIADETTSAYLRWADNGLIANGSVHDRRLTVVAVLPGGAGTSAAVVSRGGAPDDDAIGELVRAAEHSARRSHPAEDARPLLTGDGYGGASWAGPPEAAMTTEAADDLGPLVSRLATAFEQARGGRRRLFGYAGHRIRTTCLGATTGLRLRHVQPASVLDMTARTADGSASAWIGTAADGPADLDPVSLAGRLDGRLRRAAGRVELPPGRYEVLLTPSCVADLMSHLYRAAGAKDALDGRTVFSGPSGGTLAGRRLTTAPLTLRGNPGEKGLTCCPFAVARAGADTFTRASAGIESVFDNGLPLSPTRWIDDGVLTALVHTRHSAELTGLPLTPRIDNLVMEGPPGGPTLDELVASTRRGLLVTSLWYVREVDPGALLLTGLTRDGVHVVENGEVTGAVNNFRFDESPVGVLERVAEIGATERTLPREWDDDLTGMAMPALRVGDFAMTAVTRAT